MSNFNTYEPPTSGGDWLNLKDGDNKIRIVSGFEAFGRHYDSLNNKSITCIGKDEGCKYCLEAEEILEKIRELKINQDPNEKEKQELDDAVKQYNAKRSKVQFLVWAIDRTDGKVKLMRYGATIQKQLSELAKSEEYKFSDTPEYDITIKRTGQKLETEYAVMPARKNVPLTTEEKKLVVDTTKPITEVIDAMKDKAKKEPKDNIKEIDTDKLPLNE